MPRLQVLGDEHLSDRVVLPAWMEQCQMVLLIDGSKMGWAVAPVKGVVDWSGGG
jgi:hypothetical protein